MASRAIPKNSIQNLPFSSMPITVLFVLIAVFSVFSVVTFLCGSKKMKKVESEMEEERSSESKDKRLLSKINSNIGNKAVSIVKMISWRKAQAEDEEEGYGNDDVDDQALWKKTILMGERCRPLDLSGKIVYDSQGNMLPEFSHQDGYH